MSLTLLLEDEREVELRSTPPTPPPSLSSAPSAAAAAAAVPAGSGGGGCQAADMDVADTVPAVQSFDRYVRHRPDTLYPVSDHLTAASYIERSAAPCHQWRRQLWG